MKRTAIILATLIVSLLITLPAAGQRRSHDPLTPDEIDQLRDNMLEPELRLKLFVKF